MNKYGCDNDSISNFSLVIFLTQQHFFILLGAMIEVGGFIFLIAGLESALGRLLFKFLNVDGDSILNLNNC